MLLVIPFRMPANNRERHQRGSERLCEKRHLSRSVLFQDTPAGLPERRTVLMTTIKTSASRTRTHGKNCGTSITFPASRYICLCTSKRYCLSCPHPVSNNAYLCRTKQGKSSSDAVTYCLPDFVNFLKMSEDTSLPLRSRLESGCSECTVKVLPQLLKNLSNLFPN